MTCFVSNPIQSHILASCAYPLIHSTLRACSCIENAPRNAPSGRVSRVSTHTHSLDTHAHPIPSLAARMGIHLSMFMKLMQTLGARRVVSCYAVLCCTGLCPLRCGRGCRCRCEEEEEEVVLLAVSTLELLVVSTLSSC
jgi:hypothetical protein